MDRIHHHQERNHQGLNNELIAPDVFTPIGQIRRRKRLRGMLYYYYRQGCVTSSEFWNSQPTESATTE